jgi:hypothetical protein
MTSRAAISSSYAIFSFVLDPPRGTTIPIGVALWSPERRWVTVRLPEEGEQLTGFNRADHYPFVRLVREKVESWVANGVLPYAEGPLAPFEDRWWRHAKELLIHRVQLSEPRPIDCRDPEQELEPLYEAVVAPHRPAKERRTRIEGEITKCLKHLADRFKTRQRIPGFKGRDVPVLRAFHGERGWVVIEGINLATNEAEVQADATASRLMRLRAGSGQPCEVMIGYLASPEGLNGESVLVDWLQERTRARTFDLLKDRQEFLATADELVTNATGQQLLG